MQGESITQLMKNIENELKDNKCIFRKQDGFIKHKNTV